ncbi:MULTISPECIES: FAD-binding oxidoreductase [unclassified Archaeoglobus]|jgi:FAD/FMN-containing dehydrogenase|uniref:FAD-binding oxidoreductase n=1 Tax=unclassified Archaeoglobus TaxID=2643606 RepID=UPI0025C2B55A|nr:MULTISPECIES: FAD-binding oxidoreductase [unclassified Archaeoglobus]
MDSFKMELSRSVKRYDFHPIQRMLYSQDLIRISPFLKRFIKYPVCIVQPESDEEVLATLEISRRFKIPVVPRGAATSAYGGATTLKNCMVIDFSRMNSFEIKNGCAVAESGVVWLDLEKELNKAGYALRVYPTSAPASTVGGWIAQGGYGVGSLRYGDIGKNVEWIEVADFDGVKRVKGNELKYYVGLFGTTGLILRACLKLRENREPSNYAVKCSFKESLNLIEGAYHASYMNRSLSKMVGCGDAESLLLSFEDQKSDLDFDVELGNKIWKRRFYLLKAAKNANIIFTEAVLPYETVSEFYQKVGNLAIKAIFTQDCVVMLGILPERGYYSTALKVVKFIKMAEKHGGRAYATGMLFPHKKILDEDIRDYKKAVDPENLLNPGKAMQSNAISKLIRLAEMIP